MVWTSLCRPDPHKISLISRSWYQFGVLILYPIAILSLLGIAECWIGLRIEVPFTWRIQSCKRSRNSWDLLSRRSRCHWRKAILRNPDHLYSLWRLHIYRCDQNRLSPCLRGLNPLMLIKDLSRGLDGPNKGCPLLCLMILFGCRLGPNWSIQFLPSLLFRCQIYAILKGWICEGGLENCQIWHRLIWCQVIWAHNLYWFLNLRCCFQRGPVLRDIQANFLPKFRPQISTFLYIYMFRCWFLRPWSLSEVQNIRHLLLVFRYYRVDNFGSRWWVLKFLPFCDDFSRSILRSILGGRHFGRSEKSGTG